MLPCKNSLFFLHVRLILIALPSYFYPLKPYFYPFLPWLLAVISKLLTFLWLTSVAVSWRWLRYVARKSSKQQHCVAAELGA